MVRQWNVAGIAGSASVGWLIPGMRRVVRINACEAIDIGRGCRKIAHVYLLKVYGAPTTASAIIGRIGENNIIEGDCGCCRSDDCDRGWIVVVQARRGRLTSSDGKCPPFGVCFGSQVSTLI